MAVGLTLDSGALIAFERHDLEMAGLLNEAEERSASLTIPTVVLAQVWRGNSPRVAMLLNACLLEGLDVQGARAAGELLAHSRTSDIVDAVVVWGAMRRGDAIVTSD